MLKFDLVCYAQLSDSHGVRLSFNKGKYQLLNELIEETDWDPVLVPTDLQLCYDTFKDVLERLVTRCIPQAYPRGKRRIIFINKEAIKLKNKKRKLWKAYTHNQDEISYARYVR